MRLSRCLSDLGITDVSTFDGCDDVDDEFKAIRRIYLRKVLTEHPDKGGDVSAFRATQAAWEVLRDLFNGGGVKGGSFASYIVAFSARAAADRESASDDADDEDGDDFDDELYAKYANNANYASYEYYEAAAEEEVPGYRVELARSGRSKCAKCDGYIEKGSLRVGSLDQFAGTYGRWNHLGGCWRVPVKVRSGLTNPSDERASLRDLLAMEGMLLVGVSALDEASKLSFVRHCVDADNWAGNGKKRKAVAIMGAAASGDAVAASEHGSASSSAVPAGEDGPPSSATTAVPGGVSVVPGSFRVLVPGVDGARAGDALAGQSFVITGTFPEAGGGDADAVGVANVKAMIQSFGGGVITRFSKKSTHLLVGKDPVAAKFKVASKRSVVIVSLRRLQSLLLNHVSLQQLETMPALTSVEFLGSAYQAAGAPPPLPPQAAQGPNASESSSKQPADSASSVKMKPDLSPSGNDAKMPSKPDLSPPSSDAKMPSKPDPSLSGSVAKMPSKLDPSPSGNAAIGGASSNTRAIVPIVQSNNESTDVVPRTEKKAKFTIPRPGVNGAVAGVLSGKRFVLTGVFPEVGGGTGLTLGKDRTRDMIESFGGQVTSAVSGKTDFVVVGQDPGRSKVTQADKRGVPLIDLISLHRLLMGQSSLEATASAPPPRITNFSAGYAGQKRIAY